MFSKRVTSYLVVLAAVLACEFGPTGAGAQTFSKDRHLHVKSVNPAQSSFHTQKPASLRPITPGEKALLAAQKSGKPHAMTPGLPTSTTQIFKAAITSSSGG
ncbi:MAG: hypothetical protein WAN03_21430, partial [Candidatus Sulfotelmatobacter sp.]